MSQPKILLTPGPCMTTESVRLAGAGPDMNHRDPEYLKLIHETKARLLSVYPQTKVGWHPFLLGGSGTLAVEAAISSLVEKGPALILESGYYSGRIREIFEIHKIPFQTLTTGWLEPWNFERIQAELAKGYEIVVGTHNETTTGRLNDISRLGSLSQAAGSKCLIDAMSSFGADDIDFENLDAICASGNKCLHSIPGVGLVLVRSAMVSLMDQVPRRTYYMSLPLYAGDAPPLTPPVPALSALRQALRELPPGGAGGRRELYMARARYLREQLSARGLTSPVPFDELSCTLSTFSLPPGFSFDAWFSLNCDRGFVIYACKGQLRDRFFQVSNMGELSMENLRAWIDAVDDILSPS